MSDPTNHIVLTLAGMLMLCSVVLSVWVLVRIGKIQVELHHMRDKLHDLERMVSRAQREPSLPAGRSKVSRTPPEVIVITGSEARDLDQPASDSSVISLAGYKGANRPG